jgi:hypothetical protein
MLAHTEARLWLEPPALVSAPLSEACRRPLQCGYLLHWAHPICCAGGSARLEVQAAVLLQVLLCTVWAGARCVARWALGALFAAPQPAGPSRQRLPRAPPGPVVLPASPLDGGLRPY